MRLDVTAETVERLIASQFPDLASLPVVPVEPGGWDNRTFRLGDVLSVRLPTAERYAAQIDKEHRWLPHLAPSLPVAIPEPVGLGRSEFDYSFPWSVRRWIPGMPADRDLAGQPAFARQVADFLTALHQVDAQSGPIPGEHSFFRGGPLSTYDAQVRDAVARLEDRPDAIGATTIWDLARSSQWRGPAVWVHGDIAPGNLLVDAGRLCAVIDWGNCAVGDPACDLAIAWTYFRGNARSAFCNALSADDATWHRARGWALWKALILATRLAQGPAADVGDAPRVLREVLA